MAPCWGPRGVSEWSLNVLCDCFHRNIDSVISSLPSLIILLDWASRCICRSTNKILGQNIVYKCFSVFHSRGSRIFMVQMFALYGCQRELFFWTTVEVGALVAQLAHALVPQAVCEVVEGDTVPYHFTHIACDHCRRGLHLQESLGAPWGTELLPCCMIATEKRGLQGC